MKSSKEWGSAGRAAKKRGPGSESWGSLKFKSLGKWGGAAKETEHCLPESGVKLGGHGAQKGPQRREMNYQRLLIK